MSDTQDDHAAKVFISYSRRDIEVARPLRDALRKAGFDAFLDLNDIAPGEAWQDRLSQLIAAGEKLVFLISPDSVASEVCAWEIDKAEGWGKSVLPVLIRPTDLETIPGRLRRLNFINYRDDAERAGGLEALCTALATDLAWEREKTRINDLAEEWRQAGRPKRRLILRNDRLREMETWRDSHPPEAVPPTELQLDFISQSRSALGRRQRLTVLSLGIIAVVTTAAAVVAVYQSNIARQNERRAEAALEQISRNAYQLAFDLAASLNDRTDVPRSAALEVMRAAEQSIEGIAGEAARNPTLALVWSSTLSELSSTRLEAGDLDGALSSANRAFDLAQAVTPKDEADAIARHLALAGAGQRIAHVAIMTGAHQAADERLAAALAEGDRAVALSGGAAEVVEAVMTLRASYADGVVQAVMSDRRPRSALDQLDAVIAPAAAHYQGALAGEAPGTDKVLAYARLAITQANILILRDDPDAAAQVLIPVLDHLAVAVAAAPEIQSLHQTLYTARLTRARALFAAEDYVAAWGAAEQAGQGVQALLAKDAENTRLLLDLFAVFAVQGRILAKNDASEQALAAFEAALDLVAGGSAGFGTAEVLLDRARVQAEIGRLARGPLKQPGRAVAAYQAALDLRDAAHALVPNVPTQWRIEELDNARRLTSSLLEYAQYPQAAAASAAYRQRADTLRDPPDLAASWQVRAAGSQCWTALLNTEKPAIRVACSEAATRYAAYRDMEGADLVWLELNLAYGQIFAGDRLAGLDALAAMIAADRYGSLAEDVATLTARGLEDPDLTALVSGLD